MLTIPLLYRKRVKAYVERLVNIQRQSEIPETVNQDWSKPTASLPDVVIFGMIAYDFRFQRPQQLAVHLAQLGHRVFYVEHEFRPAKVQSGYAPFSVRQVANNVFVVRLTCDRNYFIYSEQMSGQGVQVTQASLRSLQQTAQLQNPVWIIQHPFWQTVLPKDSRPLIYEAFDDHGGFAQAGKWITKHERQLVQRADQCVVSSQSLFKKFSELSQHVSLISNGADTQKLSQLPELPKPVKLQQLTQPIIGYHGAIEEWFDADLLEQVLRSFPSASVVLIGAVHNQAVSKLASAYGNLHLLGEITYAELPAYLQHFQVAIIPFLVTPVIQATLPVKFFEYLALGKPVVSTQLPELQPYRKLCYLADNQTEFVAQLKIALAESDSALAKQRQAEAVKHDWQFQTQKLSQLLAHFQSKNIVD